MGIAKRYRKLLAKLNDFLADELGSKSDKLLSCKVTSISVDEETENLLVSYEAWLVNSRTRYNEIVFEESSWFEIEPVSAENGNIVFNLIEWHEGGHIEYSVFTEQIPRGLFKAWNDLYADDLYVYMSGREDELLDCRACVRKAFYKARKERGLADAKRTSELVSSQKGRLKTGMF